MTAQIAHAQALAIVGVDEKEPADYAVVAAYRIAPALKLSIELVHATAVALDYFAHVDPLGLERAQQAAAKRWSQVLEGAGVIGADLERSLKLLPGRAADVLITRAQEQRAALIVLGRHQKRGTFDFGDVVREVVVRAPCPVWVQAGAPRPIKRVLCPLDLGASALGVLEFARDVAGALGAELCALHCFVRPQLGYLLGYPVQFPTNVVDTARESAEREFAQLLERFDWRGVAHRQLFYEADPATELISLQSEFDLVVMGTHGRSGVAKALLGSVAAELLRRAEIPVLVRRDG